MNILFKYSTRNFITKLITVMAVIKLITPRYKFITMVNALKRFPIFCGNRQHIKQESIEFCLYKRSKVLNYVCS
ncbi:hypothetical protein AQUCO_05200008v1 [Aquilegia coerulea]|uniref:Uncharacterized protein n=1 Tax=Aquilegia coerulea TaxID=218851 RepID=A0A2G5CIK3_AQUCA|nr:hypothetical protein AQUCO_05200008v1 [Aquilegia coerulea]